MVSQEHGPPSNTTLVNIFHANSSLSLELSHMRVLDNIPVTVLRSFHVEIILLLQQIYKYSQLILEVENQKKKRN